MLQKPQNCSAPANALPHIRQDAASTWAVREPCSPGFEGTDTSLSATREAGCDSTAAGSAAVRVSPDTLTSGSAWGDLPEGAVSEFPIRILRSRVAVISPAINRQVRSSGS